MIELRRLDPDLPILPAGGYTEQESTERLTEVRPNGFIQKPRSRDTLMLMLTSYMLRV